MGVGSLMRMVRAALFVVVGVKEWAKKRKEKGGCCRRTNTATTTRPDWSHPSVLGLLSDLCLWGRWNLCVHTINISVSFAFCRGGTCEEEPQTGEYWCFNLVFFFTLHLLMLFFTLLMLVWCLELLQCYCPERECDFNANNPLVDTDAMWLGF